MSHSLFHVISYQPQIIHGYINTAVTAEGVLIIINAEDKTEALFNISGISEPEIKFYILSQKTITNKLDWVFMTTNWNLSIKSSYFVTWNIIKIKII